MATFKAEVYAHQKKADGTYNIKIRVTHNQKKKYLATTYFVTKDDLTRSLKLKNQYYIDECDKLIRKYRSICDGAGESLKSMDVGQVVDLLLSDKEERFDLDIVAYAREYIQELADTGHVGNSKSYQVAINSLVKFVGRDKISINEITVRFINDWINWINEQPPTTHRVKGARAQSLYISQLRAIHNRAKREFNDEDAGIIRIPFSPFNKVKIPMVPVARKRALTVDQIRAMAALEYRKILQPGTNRFNFSRDVFLLSFCLMGMNAVDLYNCTDCNGARITYQRTKTKNRRADKAEISVRIEPEIRALVDKYRDPSGERVFKFYRLYGSMDTFNASLNKGLKMVGSVLGIDGLEFYAARHSWATIALNDAGVDKYSVHAALNHVDEGMRVTDIYIRKSWDQIDNANRSVLDLMDLDLSKVDEPSNLLKQNDKQNENE